MIISAEIDPLEIEADAARTHGDRHLVDFGGREHEFYVRRRLFQGLQEAVEGLLGEHVHFVDDVDLGASRDRAVARVLDDLAHVVDAGVRGRIHLDDVDMSRVHDRLAVDAELGHDDGGLVDLAGDGIVEGAGENAGGGGLADPAHAGEDIGLVDALERERIGEGAHHRVLADQVVEIRRAIFSRQHAIRGRLKAQARPQAGARAWVRRTPARACQSCQEKRWRRGRRLDKDPPWLVRAASFRT